MIRDDIIADLQESVDDLRELIKSLDHLWQAHNALAVGDDWCERLRYKIKDAVTEALELMHYTATSASESVDTLYNEAWKEKNSEQDQSAEAQA